jgi:putative tricarboxylic transport membrane protein
MARLAFLRTSMLIPLILVFVSLGSFTASNSMGDLLVTLIFGILGYLMKVYGYPKAPLVLGLVLGRIAEGNFNLSYDLYGLNFLTRPMTFLILLLIIWSLFGPIVKNKLKREKEVAA